MKTSGTKIKKLDITKIIPAEWNYKKPFDEEDYKERFKASILRDKSAGVIAVRQVEEGIWEAIDGNHRLKAVEELGWTHVDVEDFGKISKYEAILIARRRNYNWFPDDNIQLAALMKEVAPNISIEEMAGFMPDTPDDLENMVKLADFDWEQYGASAGDGSEGHDEEELRTLRVVLPHNVYKMWLEWKEKLSLHYDEEISDARAVEIAVVEANNLPIESIM